MAEVVLEVAKLQWLDVPLQESDLCAHGAVKVSIADEVLCDGKESDWCVSASALHLHRTLKADHVPSPNHINHLIEHCGHGMFASPDGGDVIINGCNLGIDFNVLHAGTDVILQTSKGTKVTVPLREWASLVAGFSDAMQSFYDRSPRRKPEDSTEAAGYSAFVTEWHRSVKRLNFSSSVSHCARHAANNEKRDARLLYIMVLASRRTHYGLQGARRERDCRGRYASLWCGYDCPHDRLSHEYLSKVVQMTERTFTPYSPGRMDYPPLPARLKIQFDAIAPCDHVAKGARPCMVTLEDGTVLETVYVAPAQGYIDIWGVWPKDDRGKKEIDISKVAKIAESPRCLPKRFTDKLYEAGEDGMGYCLFTAVFKDGSAQAYLAGGALDFIPLPVGMSVADIVDVIPYEGRHGPNRLESLDFHWCLFGVGESHIGSFKVEPPF